MENSYLRVCVRRGQHKLFLLLAVLIFLSIGLFSIPLIHLNIFSSETQQHSSNLIESQILNQPWWLKTRSWGISKRNFPGIKSKDLEGSAWDNEERIAWTNFFNGTTNGLMIELGAVDGKSYSVSKFFEEKARWKVILIEGSGQALDIPHNRPSALSLQLAICQEESIVHFIHGREVGGILEFMTPVFLKRFHKDLLVPGWWKVDSGHELLDWQKVKEAEHVIETPCVPLQGVFDHFGISHINFMVLDLEGGELAALMSLDFDRIQFDVICVETNRFENESDPYINQTVDFLLGKGYNLFQRTNGRNSWFVSPKFKGVH